MVRGGCSAIAMIRLLLILLLSACFATSAEYFKTGGNVRFSQRVIITTSVISTPAPTADLLWWKLNEGSGTAVTGYASSGGDSGTMDGSWLTGKSGSGFAADLNGTTGDAATSAAITYGSSKITVCFWAYPDTADANTRFYVESSTDINFNSSCFRIYSDTAGLKCLVKGTAGIREESITKPASGAWVHILAVLDNSTATGDVAIYKDGVLQSESVTANTKSGSGNFAAYTTYFGSRNRGGAFFYDGRLDDVRIYSDDQSANVVAIMNDAQ